MAGQTQKESLPFNEPQDVVMSNLAETAPSHDDKNDVDSIAKIEFCISELKREKRKVQDLRTKNSRLAKRNVDLMLEIDTADKRCKSTSAALRDTRQDLQDTRQDLQNTRQNLQDSQQDLQDTQQSLRACEKDIGKIQRREDASKRRFDKKYQTLQQKLKLSQEELRASRIRTKELQKGEENFQEAQEHIVMLKSELLACKDDLFRLQPITPLPDSLIVKNFESISQQIVHWIDAEVEQAYQDETEQIFSAQSGVEATTFLEHSPAAGEYLARFLIHRFLQFHVFSAGILLFGLPEETQMWLQKAEESMAKLQPPRDPLTIATWRSETLQALAATTEQNNLKLHQARRVNDRLFCELGQIFPKLFNQESKRSFLQEVTMPAVNLAITMRGSTTKYAFKLNLSPNKEIRTITVEDFKRFRLLDIKTGKDLKPNKVVVDVNGSIGNTVLNLEPSLCRVFKNEKTVVLFPAMILIELSHPLGKPNNRT